ncbi:hypothetical protein NDU88_005399 [Pleurodeles waltl]|uniref:Uncharacterized protein n=1 Tax=Pleurodeles waltl TaxID=8319 RepID=A0AAV7LMN4_PLEWA|nr:hypothetical protein NDU88_005399 [Pleurodeles waltl]
MLRGLLTRVRQLQDGINARVSEQGSALRSLNGERQEQVAGSGETTNVDSAHVFTSAEILVVRQGLSDMADDQVQRALLLLQEGVARRHSSGLGLLPTATQEKCGGPGKVSGAARAGAGRIVSGARGGSPWFNDTPRKTQRVEFTALKGFTAGSSRAGDLSAACTSVRKGRGRGRVSRVSPVPASRQSEVQ